MEATALFHNEWKKGKLWEIVANVSKNNYIPLIDFEFNCMMGDFLLTDLNAFEASNWLVRIYMQKL